MGYGLFQETKVDTSTMSAKEYETYKQKRKTKRIVWAVLGGVVFVVIAGLVWASIGFDKNYTSANAIENMKNDIDAYIASYKKMRYSGYDFEIKTSSSNRGSLIYTETKGSSARNVTETKTYFTNDFEISSNFDSSFMYQNAGFKDGVGGQAMLNNGEVHNYITKSGWFSTKDEDLGIGTYSEYDDYYLFDAFEFIKEDISSIKIRSRPLSKAVEYHVKSKNCSALFDYFNNNYRVDIFENCSFPVKAFGTVIDGSLNIESCDYCLEMVENKINRISYSMKGKAINKYQNSGDCYTENDTDFKLSCDITIKNYKYTPSDKI